MLVVWNSANMKFSNKFSLNFKRSAPRASRPPHFKSRLRREISQIVPNHKILFVWFVSDLIDFCPQGHSNKHNKARQEQQEDRKTRRQGTRSRSRSRLRPRSRSTLFSSFFLKNTCIFAINCLNSQPKQQITLQTINNAIMKKILLLLLTLLTVLPHGEPLGDGGWELYREYRLAYIHR